jgi:iron(III) transport system substrate-binding protein
MKSSVSILSGVLLLALASCGGSTAGAPAASPAGGAAPASAAAKPGTTASTGGSDLQAIVEAAKKEGELTLSHGSTLGAASGAKVLQDAFNKTYNTNITFNYTPGDSFPAMVLKITQENQAKKTASTDVVFSLPDTLETAITAGSIQKVDWKSWAPNIQRISSPEVIAPDGTAVALSSYMSGISYNSNKLKGDQIPTSMADLLKPQYKGSMASTPYATAFDWLATDSLWGYDKTLEYVKKFSQQVNGLLRCGETQRIASGEFSIFALDCSQGNSLKTKAAGAPVDYILPSDAIVSQFMYAAVPSTAAHPNVAKLFINFMEGDEGQQLLRQLDQNDLHLLPGSSSAKLIAQAEANHGKVVVASAQYAREHYLPNGPKNKDEFSKILEAGGK